MIIVQITNKIFIVFFTKRNLDTNTFFNIYVSQQDRSLMAVKCVFFFNFNIINIINFFTHLYIYGNILFMFYNVALFSVKLEFCINFTASILLIKLIRQRYSETLMFKIAISLRFMDIISKSCHPLQTFGWNLKL